MARGVHRLMGMRRALPLLLFCVLAALWTGCAFRTYAEPAEPQAISEQALPPYRVSLLLYGQDFRDRCAWGEDAVSAALDERFSIELEFVNAGVNFESTIKLLVASNSLPEMLQLQRDHVFQWLANERRLLNLSPLIAQNSQYAEIVGDETLELSRYKGSIYTMLGQSATQPDGTGGWILNEKIYRTMGSPPLSTLGDMERYLSAVRGKIPSTASDPLICLQMGIPFDYSQLYVAHGGGRVPEFCSMHIWLDRAREEFVFIGEDPAFAETMLLLRRLYQNSLIDEGWFIEQNEQVYETLATGSFALLCANDVTGYMLDALMQWEKDTGSRDFIIIQPLRKEGVASSEVFSSSYSGMGKLELAIHADSEQPERIYQMLDWIASAEGQLLVEFGPESLYWDEVDASGYPVMNARGLAATPEERKNNGLGAWNIVSAPLFVHEAKAVVNLQLPEPLQDIKTIWKDSVMDRHSYDISELRNIAPYCDGLENTAKILCGQLIDSCLPRIVSAKSEEEALFYIDDLNRQVHQIGFDFVLSHYNWQYRENSNGQMVTSHEGD